MNKLVQKSHPDGCASTSDGLARLTRLEFCGGTLVITAHGVVWTRVESSRGWVRCMRRITVVSREQGKTVVRAAQKRAPRKASLAVHG